MKLEDENLGPFTGKDFGQPGEDDADGNAPAADEAADEAADAAATAAERRERDDDVMIAAAAAALRRRRPGRLEERVADSSVRRRDGTPTGVATGRLLVTTRDVTFQHTPGITASRQRRDEDDDAAGDAPLPCSTMTRRDG